jgi:predicted permease
VLTVGASLLVKSLIQVYGRDPGFTVEHVVTMKMSLPEARYAGERLPRFADRVEEQVRTVPGVKAAAMAINLPLELGPDLPFTIEGRYMPGTQTGVGDAQYRANGPGYFTALRIALEDGRLLDARDTRNSLPVALVNETFARRYFPRERAIGHRIHVGMPVVPDLADASPREIVGVVADVHEQSLQSTPPPIVYVPLAQQNDALATLLIRVLPFTLVVRTIGDPSGLAPALQRAVWEVDPEQPVTNVRTMADIVEGSLGSARFNAGLLAALAGLALVLAAAGLYGLIAHMVGQETRAIGVRMALGSTRGAVVRLFLKQAAWLVAGGSVIGMAAAWGVTRFLQGFLTGVSTTDPWVFAVAPAVILIVALVAALRPAVLASRVDPVEALRAD